MQAKGTQMSASQRGVWGFPQFSAQYSHRPVEPGGTTIVAFGDGLRGQLGLDPMVANRRLRGTLSVVEELRGYDPVQVEAAGMASFILLGRGYLWAFGSNRSMELGLRKEVAQLNAAQRIKTLREMDVTQVAGSKSTAGQSHTLVLTSRGHVYSFGTSAEGALGQGENVKQAGPMLLRMTVDRPVRLVIAGAQHSLLITDQGRVYTFGDNSFGQLGLGPRRGTRVLSSVADPEPPDEWHAQAGLVKFAAAGNNHNMAVTTSGDLFAWGANANGQLGLDRMGDQYTPHLVKKLGRETGICSVSCGAYHTLAIARQGTQVWVWGSNIQGQLGVGKPDDAEAQQRNAPSMCHSLSNRRGMEVVQVAAAACHSLALTRRGEVYAFGDNTSGQLGFSPDGGRAAVAAASLGARSDPAAELAVKCLWEPTKIQPLSIYQIRMITTAEMHSVVLAA